MKKLITSTLLLATLLTSCSREELSIDADVVSYDTESPDVYLMSDLNNQHMGWVEKLNRPESDYYFVEHNDSITLQVNKPYSRIDYLTNRDAFQSRKTITVSKYDTQHYSFRIYHAK